MKGAPHKRMARKPARADGATPIPPATGASRRARSEITFEDQRLLGPLFGQFDANLVQVENRLGGQAIGPER